MNKTAIRNFAVWARNKLINDVTYKAGLMGVTVNGIADPLPQSTDNVQFFDIGMSEPYQITAEEIKQRKGLVEIIRRKEKDSDYATAFSSVVEEVAYTWFNRLIAIRFMEVNDYLPSHIRVLSSESGKLEPDLVTTPYDAELFFSNGEKQIVQSLKNENKLDEVFRMLFIKQCNALYTILPRLFENLSDYTELLLNVSFIDQEGVVYHLVHDIPEEDFNVELGGQVEIIGWLYQFYNAEIKDETFESIKKNIKVTKERIPAVTQLFTPDWIVRYMVENSLGRFWLEGHNHSDLKENWHYYLEEAEQEKDVTKALADAKVDYARINPEDIKIIDPCMGSGHVLVYAFDVLMQIYESAGWSQRDAAKSILENNIYGLDIDDRAAQLAYFAVMMKARQYSRRILTEAVECHVMSIKESNGIDRSVLNRLGDLQEIGNKLVESFVDAKEYGSILNLDITIDELDSLKRKLDEIERMEDYGDLFVQYESTVLVNELPVYIDQAKSMIQRYEAVITNPPYRGIGDVSDKLQSYAMDNYPDSRSDLSTICMDKFINMIKPNGFMAMINIPVWMTLTSYIGLRKKILNECTIVNLLHLGRGIFGSDFGTVAFVFKAGNTKGYKGLNRRLYEKKGAVESGESKIKRFFDNPKDFVTNQDIYKEIPGMTISYGATDSYIEAIKNGNTISSVATVFEGLKTRDNERFLRVWFEVFDNKWKPYSKGGAFRRWYGNNEYVVNWGEDGSEVRAFKKSSGANFKYYFSPAITYTAMTMSSFTGRYIDQNIFGGGGGGITNSDCLNYLLGFVNSKPFDSMISEKKSTVNFEVGQINEQPVIYADKEERKRVDDLVEQNIQISRKDWDSFETSWDFKKHPLI